MAHDTALFYRYALHEISFYGIIKYMTQHEIRIIIQKGFC